MACRGKELGRLRSLIGSTGACSSTELATQLKLHSFPAWANPDSPISSLNSQPYIKMSSSALADLSSYALLEALPTSS
jgi:hypothetical protein